MANLGDKGAIATIAVRDLKTAARFYLETLGLRRTGPEDPEALFFETGKSTIAVYPSHYAGTNKATAVTWEVEDLETMVRDLKGRGVVFEHYDLPGSKRDGDIHMAGSSKVAWFKDPDGNIHSLFEP